MDAYLHSSGLDPLRANLPVRSGFSGAQSLFRVCGEILQWDRFTTFARSPVIDDRYNRIYWTTCTSPGLMVQQAQAMTDNSAGYDLGLLQPPAEAPSVTVDRGGPGVSTTPVRFVITLVDTCSYDPGDPDAVPPVPPSGAVETGPSATSNGLAYLDGVDGVSLRTYVPPATCADGSFRYARKRIYALIGGQYYFLDEIPRNQSLWSVEPLVVDTASPVVLPSGPPNAQVAPRATLTIGGNQRDTAFVYTWVSQFGEETQPSPASPVLTYDDGTDCVTVSFPPPPAAPGATG